MCATREQCAARLCRCAGALLLLAALAAASAERDAQLVPAPAPFILGSRFGRSQPRLVAPRNDKFFLSSRYGKRSEPAGGLPPLVPPAVPPLSPPAPPELLCEYTGLAALYRCRAQRERRYHDDRRLWDETTSEDE